MIAAYDAFQHLRRALFWSVDTVVFALTFYSDDAGKRADDEYLVASGYLGTVAQWERFAPDWRLALASVGLPYFHASDFFVGADPFAGWNTKERQRDREKLLHTLSQIIKDYTLHSFTAAVHVPGWVKANEEYILDEVGFSPFPLVARLSVQRAREWASVSGYDPNDIEYIFDQGCEDWGKLQHRLKVDFAIDAIDRDKEKIRPLQAADWLAYEEFREVPQRTKLRGRKLRGSYMSLLRVPFDPLVFHFQDIMNSFCLDPAMKVHKRSPQGTAAVRLRFDDRKMKVVSRRYKRLGKRLRTLVAKDVAVDTLQSADSADIEDEEFVSSNPRVAAVQMEVHTARIMKDMHAKTATGLLEVMRSDNPENQDNLLKDFLAAMRSQREWTEKHIAGLEKLAEIVETQED